MEIKNAAQMNRIFYLIIRKRKAIYSPNRLSLFKLKNYEMPIYKISKSTSINKMGIPSSLII